MIEKREQFLKNTFESLGGNDFQDDKYHFPSKFIFYLNYLFFITLILYLFLINLLLFLICLF